MAGVLAVGLLLGLAGPLLVAGPAAAADTRACPRGAVPATTFTDTTTSVHRAAIDCAAWWGIVQGRSTTSFAPNQPVTRGQTAAMLARLLRDSGGEVAPAEFADTDGHLFEADIDLLAGLGIIAGVSPTRFAPDLPVTRAQMATMLVQTFERGFASPLPAGTATFGDVPATNVHRQAIATLADAGITTGTSPTTFAPGQHVTRAQLASFVARATSVLVTTAGLSLPTGRPAADDAYGSRMRAAWVHLFDDTLKSPAGVRRLVDELVAADATAVIAQVARRHDAYYDSQVLTRTVDPRLTPGFDVLAALIDAAHAAGLEVHAWYGVAPTWHGVYDDLPRPAGWLPREHGRDAPAADRWVTRTHDGAWSDYLDPGVLEVQDHVAEVVAELVTRYPVDGIHLDYVRYSSAQHGYNPRALARFRAETGRSDTPAPDDAQWSAWRRDQTRAIIQRAAGAIEGVGREVTLSAAVITWTDGPATPDRAGFTRSSPYTRTLQDWDRWVRSGDLDMVLPMNYFRAHDAQQAGWFDRWQSYQRALAAAGAAQVVPGPAGYLNHPDAVAGQVRAAMRIDGAAVYSYQQPTVDASRGIWARLAETRWGYHPRR